jgi:hypothetical protein
MVRLLDSAHSSEPMLNSRIAPKKIFGAEAVGDPARGRDQQGHGEHVGDDHPCMRSGSSARSWAMAGRAVLRIVPSRDCMKKAMATTQGPAGGDGIERDGWAWRTFC